MKIVKETFLEELGNRRIEELEKQYNFVYLNNVEKHKHKWKYVSLLGWALVIILVFIINRHDITPMMSEDNTTFETVLIILAVGVSTKILTYLHELIHLLAFPRGWSKKYIVFTRFDIIPFYDGFTSKRRWLIMAIAPVIIIGGLLVLLYFIFNLHLIITLIFFSMNLMISMQDIYIFFDHLKNAPKNSYVYGNAFTTDISREKYKELLYDQ